MVQFILMMQYLAKLAKNGYLFFVTKKKRPAMRGVLILA